MKVRFVTADVFTDQRFAGNPLAVVPDARGLTAEQMQKITCEFNYSESTFVLPAEHPENTRRVRIFTPAGEIPFAGHPTLGTALVLARTGEIEVPQEVNRIVFEEGVGAVPVSISVRNGVPSFAQLTAAKLPESRSGVPSAEDLAEVLCLRKEDILSGDHAPIGLSCGLPFLFVPVRNLDAVRRARMNQAAWERTLQSAWARDLYVFTFETMLPGSSVHSRMYSMDKGVSEDPATGSAAAALAGYLAPRHPGADGTLKWTIEQGIEMGRPSILYLEADRKNGKLMEVRVGGSAVLMTDGSMELP